MASSDWQSQSLPNDWLAVFCLDLDVETGAISTNADIKGADVGLRICPVRDQSSIRDLGSDISNRRIVQTDYRKPIERDISNEFAESFFQGSWTTVVFQVLRPNVRDHRYGWV